MKKKKSTKAVIDIIIQERNYKWILLAKYLSAECNEEESNKLKKILTVNPDFKAIANALSKIWNTTINENYESLQESWNRHLQRMDEKGISFSKKLN